jgi:penicillin-binding protein 1A
MAEQNKKSNKKKEQRQSWKPHWLPDTIYKIWLAVFAVFKIALGALATVLLIVVVCGFVFVGILGDYLQEDILPDSEMVKENYDMDETSFIHYVDADGNIQELQQIYASSDRDWATFDEIPKDLVNAAVAIEDKRFYEHQGVDWITTVKACAGMFFGSGDAGGSTITQQLVKNMTGDNSITVRRKVVEIFKAQDFERRYDKETIMEWYLNLIYFGDRKNGVKSAAAHYFGKELCNLTTAECASLISITNNPSIFSPYTDTFKYKGEELSGRERNNIRKENTLWMMRNEGYLTEEEYQAALAQEIVFKSGIAPEDRMAYCENEACGYKGIVASLTVKDDKYFCPQCQEAIRVTDYASSEVYSWFVDTVLEDVAAALAEKDGRLWEEMGKQERSLYLQIIQRSGYHIYTTLDKNVQDQVDKIYTDLKEIPETRGGQQLQSGIIVIDNRTGDIVAMAGGVGEKVVFDAFNMATDAKRQIGSSIKPLSVYTPAFELGGFSPATVVKDLPLRYSVKEDPDAPTIPDPDAEPEYVPYPHNSDRKYSYSRTILSAVMDSVNAVAVNTVDIIGTRYSYNFAKKLFRISGLLEKGANGTTDIDFSPLALGGLTNGATVRDMASAYATFANQGIYREGRTFTKVYDSQGNMIIDNQQDSEKILSEKTVDYMNYCLDQAVDAGTGTAADLKSIGIDVCGKTGTTNSKNDRYFCGFTGYYTAAVWCGYEIPAEIQLVGNTSHPGARLWKKVMEPLHKGKENIPLYNEDNMISVTVCLDSGKLATDACIHDIREIDRTQTVLVYPEDAPEDYCDAHIPMDYCVEGGAAANEYCKKFQQVGMVKLEDRALVKLTQAMVDELAMAKKVNLRPEYTGDGYIYLVDENGNPTAFHGIEGDLNPDGTDCCLRCTVHTQEKWEQYKNENPWVDQPTEPGGDTPKDPDNGGNWWDDLWPFG